MWEPATSTEHFEISQLRNMACWHQLGNSQARHDLRHQCGILRHAVQVLSHALYMHSRHLFSGHLLAEYLPASAAARHAVWNSTRFPVRGHITLPLQFLAQLSIHRNGV